MSAGQPIWKNALPRIMRAGRKSTRGRQWRLVHSEVFNTRGEAMAREYELKKDRKTRRALMLGAGLDGMPD